MKSMVVEYVKNGLCVNVIVSGLIEILMVKEFYEVNFKMKENVISGIL